MEKVKLEFREDALKMIANKAIKRKTGARGLRSIIENVLLEPMFDIPSDSSIDKLVIDEGVVLGDSEPLKIYASKDNKRSAGAVD